MKSTKVEVESGELALKNSNGDIVIIPKKHRLEVQGMIDDKCWGCVDKYVSTLPTMKDYAEDGSIIPTTPELTEEQLMATMNSQGGEAFAKKDELPYLPKVSKGWGHRWQSTSGYRPTDAGEPYYTVKDKGVETIYNEKEYNEALSNNSQLEYKQ